MPPSDRAIPSLPPSLHHRPILRLLGASLLPSVSVRLGVGGQVVLGPLTALVLLAMAIALPCVAAYAIDLRSRCLAAAGCIAEQAAEAQEAVARARIAEDALRRVLADGDK